MRVLSRFNSRPSPPQLLTAAAQEWFPASPCQGGRRGPPAHNRPAPPSLMQHRINQSDLLHRSFLLRSWHTRDACSGDQTRAGARRLLAHRPLASRPRGAAVGRESNRGTSGGRSTKGIARIHRLRLGLRGKRSSGALCGCMRDSSAGLIALAPADRQKGVPAPSGRRRNKQVDGLIFRAARRLPRPGANVAAAVARRSARRC